MPFPRRLLTSGEQVVHEMRPHWKARVAPIVWTIVVWAAAGLIYGQLGDGQRAWLIPGALLVWIVVAGWPLLRWRFTEYTVTNERLISRSGVIAKRAKEIPLERINDVTFTQSVLDRLLGAGDLVLESAGESGQQLFNDIGHPEQIQKLIYETSEARKAAFRAGGGQSSIADEIAKLGDLLDRGLITDDEFAARKRRLLSS